MRLSAEPNVAAGEREHGRTPLHVAADAANLEVVNLLIQHGANISAQDNDSYTPFELAEKAGHIAVSASSSHLPTFDISLTVDCKGMRASLAWGTEANSGNRGNS